MKRSLTNPEKVTGKVLVYCVHVSRVVRTVTLFCDFDLTAGPAVLIYVQHSSRSEEELGTHIFLSGDLRELRMPQHAQGPRMFLFVAFRFSGVTTFEHTAIGVLACS